MERAYALGEISADAASWLEWMKFSLADLEADMRAAFEQTHADHANVPTLCAIKAAPVRGNNYHHGCSYKPSTRHTHASHTSATSSATDFAHRRAEDCAPSNSKAANTRDIRRGR